jgi:hypothetical protein
VFGYRRHEKKKKKKKKKERKKERKEKKYNTSQLDELVPQKLWH